MTSEQSKAFDAAKEITIAALSTGQVNAHANNGDSVATFFETLYKKALELTR